MRLEGPLYVTHISSPISLARPDLLLPRDRLTKKEKL